MSASTLSCGVCELRHITKSSIIWCTECDEGLCTECEEHHSLSKSSRDHNTIPITNYQKLPPDVLKISQYCDKHNVQFQIYCKNHESPCCSNCVVESHNECRDFTKLSEAILHAKTSNAFLEIENTLAEVSENITKIRENRQENLKNISEKRIQIEQEIEQTRITINNHLDKLQEEIRKELYEVEEKENKEISQFISLLEEKENEISECQTNISSIKQYASDLQAFLVIKKLESDVSLKYQFLQSLIDKDTIKQHSLIYHLNTDLPNILLKAHTFGKVLLEAKPFDVALTRNKEKQAQITIPYIETKSIDDISLKLNKTINGTGNDVCGFCMLRDGKMAFTNYGTGIRILDKDGSFECDVKTTHATFDVEYINKNNTLAVTTGNSKRKSIIIIDLNDKKVEKTELLDWVAYGIARKDEELIFSGEERGICTINLQDKCVRNIVRDQMPHYCYVATFGDNIYHTNPRSNCVTCYDLKGIKKWKFWNEDVLKYPLGISVDNDGTVFVVGQHSQNVVAISSDGKRHKEVLSSKDGPSNPWSLLYDRSTNQLLVANIHDKAFIYKFI